MACLGTATLIDVAVGERQPSAEMGSTMRVLQLHNLQGPGGATTTGVSEVGALEVLTNEADLLRAAGHNVELYTCPPAEDLGLSEVRLGMKAIWNAEAFRDVIARTMQFQPDVAHVHTPFPVLSPAVFHALHKNHVATVTTVHSYRYSCIAGTCFRNGAPCEDCIGRRLKFPGLLHRCYHDSFGASGALTLSLTLHRGLGTFQRAVDRFIALTPFSKRVLVHDGIPAHKVVVKPNSVPDPGVATPGGGDHYAAFAGRLVDVKGIRTLLDAWSRVTKGEFRLRIAGDGPLRHEVEQRCENDRSVEYVGWLDERGVNSLFAGAQCVVVPSQWYEGGVPLVVLRSLAVGTPVIVSNHENLQEAIIEGVTGVTFLSGDAESLAAVLNEAVTRPAHFRAMRTQARKFYIQRYSPRANLQRLEAIYGDVLADRSGDTT